MTSGTKAYSILITDDDSGCRDSLREIVELDGYRVLLASSGEEAVEIVRAVEVHLTLMDMHMPTLTGLETLQMVRQIKAIIPCILVTADVTEQLMRQAQQAQVYSVIPKPVSKNVLLYTVFRALVRVYGPIPNVEPPGDFFRN